MAFIEKYFFSIKFVVFEFVVFKFVVCVCSNVCTVDYLETFEILNFISVERLIENF